MLRRAAATGLPQVSDESHEVDAEGGIAGEIAKILAAHGIGGAAGATELDPDELRALHARVSAALRRQGVEADPGGGGEPGDGTSGGGEAERRG